MEQFEYYKRGQGELDTSNFPAIVEQGALHVDKIDEKTLVSLWALDLYIHQTNRPVDELAVLTVIVDGYVQHMRGDKDEMPVSNLYSALSHLNIICRSIQHESTRAIKSAVIDKTFIAHSFDGGFKYAPFFIGADSSVNKFFPAVDVQAEKVRIDGKVQSVKITWPDFSLDRSEIIIVDDILGGGATIQMLLDIIAETEYSGKIHLWVAYNEGIHTQEFLDQFEQYYIGDLI